MMRLRYHISAYILSLWFHINFDLIRKGAVESGHREMGNDESDKPLWLSGLKCLRERIWCTYIKITSFWEDY